LLFLAILDNNNVAFPIFVLEFLCQFCSLEFFKSILRQESKWSTKRCPELYLRKREKGTWAKLQKGGKLPWVKVDWGKWADSDEEDEKGNFDTKQMQEMDFSSVTDREAEGSDDRDSILADLDEDIEVSIDEEEKPAVPVSVD